MGKVIAVSGVAHVSGFVASVDPGLCSDHGNSKIYSRMPPLKSKRKG